MVIIIVMVMMMMLTSRFFYVVVVVTPLRYVLYVHRVITRHHEQGYTHRGFQPTLGLVGFARSGHRVYAR